MKMRFWASVVLLLTGAVVLGYWSGRYHALKQSQENTYRFIEHFMRSTDVESYLQQQGQPEWSARLRTYAYAGPDSHFRVRRRSSSIMLLGLLGVTGGLAGLRFAVRPRVGR